MGESREVVLNLKDTEAVNRYLDRNETRNASIREVLHVAPEPEPERLSSRGYPLIGGDFHGLAVQLTGTPPFIYLGPNSTRYEMIKDPDTGYFLGAYAVSTEYDGQSNRVVRKEKRERN